MIPNTGNMHENMQNVWNMYGNIMIYREHDANVMKYMRIVQASQPQPKPASPRPASPSPVGPGLKGAKLSRLAQKLKNQRCPPKREKQNHRKANKKHIKDLANYAVTPSNGPLSWGAL